MIRNPNITRIGALRLEKSKKPDELGINGEIYSIRTNLLLFKEGALMINKLLPCYEAKETFTCLMLRNELLIIDESFL